MLWMQGKRDCRFDFMAAAYQDNLAGLIEAVRADAGQPDLPFLIGQICPRLIDLTMFQHEHAHRDLVRSGQQAVVGSVANTSAGAHR